MACGVLEWHAGCWNGMRGDGLACSCNLLCDVPAACTLQLQQQQLRHRLCQVVVSLADSVTITAPCGVTVYVVLFVLCSTKTTACDQPPLSQWAICLSRWQICCRAERYPSFLARRCALSCSAAAMPSRYCHELSWLQVMVD
jgi:hypothetical protein